MIAQNKDWYDVLCVLDLPTNSVTVTVSADDLAPTVRDKRAASIIPKPNRILLQANSSSSSHTSTKPRTASTSSSSNGVAKAPPLLDILDDDHLFLPLDTRFLASLQSVLAANHPLPHQVIEDWLRIRFREYTLKLIDFTHVYNLQHRHSDGFDNLPGSVQPLSFYSDDLACRNAYIDTQHMNNTASKYYSSNIARLMYLSELPALHDAYCRSWAVCDIPSSSGSQLNTARNSCKTNAVGSVKANPATVIHAADGPDIDDEGDSADATFSRDGKLHRTAVNINMHDNYYLKWLLRSYTLKLQLLESPSDHELEDILNNIKGYLVSEAMVQVLIVSLGESGGGLHLISAGLFSSNPHLRFLVVNILLNIEEYDSTRPILLAMNNMHKTAYQRNLNKANNGALFVESDRYQERLQHMRESIISAAEAAAALAPTHTSIIGSGSGSGSGGGSRIGLSVDEAEGEGRASLAESGDGDGDVRGSIDVFDGYI